jgi:hypothetical protein
MFFLDWYAEKVIAPIVLRLYSIWLCICGIFEAIWITAILLLMLGGIIGAGWLIFKYVF